ncbi:MAG TPA: toluene tolerance protein [Methylotenera sp.]|nr:toluene tolerance protein [Methylotenera sp.]
MKNQLMTRAELAALQTSGKTLEQDKHGIKVTLLPDGNILKVFRLHGWFSSSLIYSNARSFCRNALRLKKLGIPTVDIISLHHLENRNFTAVVYAPLAGKTVRDLLLAEAVNKDMFEKLGIFIASLHSKGVCFRSIHLGNVVYHQGALGLIDIADMRIYPWSLFYSTIIRNFKHLYRYRSDIQVANDPLWQVFFDAYFDVSHLSKKQQSLCKRTLYPHFGLAEPI